MPGLVGFTDKHHKYNIDMLHKMRILLKHFDNYVDEELYSDKNIYVSRTHLGVINLGNQPYVLDNRYLSWMEGEFYNQQELKAKYNAISITDNELLVNIYHSTRSFEYLKDIDGYYTALLYDKKEKKINLITDRYGFKPLYWGVVNGDLVWSSELKGFLGHADFKSIIDRGAVEEFFDIGYLLENRTWFESIELVPPASILTFDIKKSKHRVKRYWFWGEIKPIKGSIDEGEIVEELGKLFKQSVRRRVNKNERVGISLSGGLDSRAILAAVPDNYKPLYTYTFGRKGCDDVTIARMVSKIKGAVYHSFDINSINWLKSRVKNIWITDGNLNLLHMHAFESSISMKKYFDINLNGFAGDLVLGGSYLRSNHLDNKINSKIVKNITNCEGEYIKFKKWYLVDKSDPYFINNRVRRFTNSGTILIAQLIEQRKPFFANELIEFVYRIPDKLRYKSSIYKKMLLNEFPEYYYSVPWQKTGCPISYSKWLVEVVKFKRRVVNKFKNEFQRFGFNFNDLNNYIDYPNWIRQEPAKSFFKRILLDEKAIYPEYVDRHKVRGYVKSHMEDKINCHNELCLALTFELWLQQIFEGKYRD